MNDQSPNSKKRSSTLPRFGIRTLKLFCHSPFEIRHSRDGHQLNLPGRLRLLTEETGGQFIETLHFIRDERLNRAVLLAVGTQKLQRAKTFFDIKRATFSGINEGKFSIRHFANG